MKTRVLLVDDDPGVATAVGDMLSSEGYDVVYARNGREAVEDFSTHGPIGLVLLDLCMPEMDGWDTFERLTAIDPLVAIIVITARADQQTIADNAGVGALMEKPLNIPRLLEIMQTLLAESAEERLARIAGQSPGALHVQPKKPAVTQKSKTVIRLFPGQLKPGHREANRPVRTIKPKEFVAPVRPNPIGSKTASRIEPKTGEPGSQCLPKIRKGTAKHEKQQDS